MRSRDYLVWIDCEMTGLDPEKNTIIEIATIITDNNLTLIDEGPTLAIHQSEKTLKAMDAWNRKHHGESGLWDRVLASSMSLAEAEEATLKFLRKHCYKGCSPLCGNSIGQDKRFLVKYMPKLHDFFHYQVIDVSTIKQLVGRWYGSEKAAPPKQEKHLALDDIKESVSELKFYKKNVFKAQNSGRKSKG